MSGFPIANMIRRGAPIKGVNGLGQWLIDSNPLCGGWRNLLDQAVYFDVNIASQLYWLGMQ